MYVLRDRLLGQAPFVPPAPLSGLHELNPEVQMIQKELDRGTRDKNKLTNLVFFGRHKERGGRALRRDEPEFHKLSREWLDIQNKLVIPALQALPSKPVPVQPASPDCQLPMFLLEYEGSPGKNRCITLSDKELEKNHIDWSIVDSTATVDIEAGKILRWEVRYKDGRKNVFDANTIPVIKGPPPKGSSISLIGHYLMKTDGFIYPVYNGRIRYDWIQTPLLIEMRNELDTKLKALRQLRLLMYLTASFASAVAASGKGISSIQTISGNPLNPTNLQTLESLLK